MSDFGSGIEQSGPMHQMSGRASKADLRRRIATLEAEILRSDRAVEDAAVALEVCDVELAELSRHVSDLCAAFNSYQIEQHELDCDERDGGVAIFYHVADIIYGERTFSKLKK